MSSLINSIKVLIFYLIIAIGSFFGLVFAQTPAVPFIFLNRRFYFRWCSFAMGYYLLMVTCLLEDLLGIKIVVTGDDLTKDKKRSLILLNHRTRLDWMFIWMLQSRFEILAQLKIVLKAQLKQIPGPGWAMQHAAYLFLDRNWEKDQQTMKNISGYYKSSQAPLSILIFPEGTNLTDEAKMKSNNYAAKQTKFNRSYDYCLHPRLNGFTFLLKTMRSGWKRKY
jgi:lysocardiolipin and lysophospholipid acyltransferase